MKQRAFKRPCRLALGVVCFAAVLAPFALVAQDATTPAPLDASPPPASSASPAGSISPAPKSKAAKAPKATKVPNPNRPVSKDIPIPLPIGEISKRISIPQVDLMGQLTSQLKAMQIKRIDEDHVEMETMNLDLYQADGKSDFHIVVPTSVFNLKTRIIHSDFPVSIHTQDFDLTGEKMEFDTVERTGKLMGKVQMRVHNLKKVAGQSDETKPE